MIAGEHTTRPAREEDRLGSAAVVEAEFAFLPDLGLPLVELGHTVARYGTGRRGVLIYQEGGADDPRVDLGYRVERRAVPSMEYVSLRDVIALERDPVGLGYGDLCAVTPELAAKLLRRLAEWTRAYGVPALLALDDDVVDRASGARSVRATREHDATNSSRLRTLADVAWRRRDFVAVVGACVEVERELSTVELRPSERGRLA